MVKKPKKYEVEAEIGSTINISIDVVPTKKKKKKTSPTHCAGAFGTTASTTVWGQQ